MCGLYGMVSLTGALRWPERADRMAEAVRERGPDAHGRHVSPEAVIGVHRLRVVDVSPAGDQPFVDGSRVLAVNGEIYNAATLRRLFPDWRFRSRTDGEALLPLLRGGDPGAFRAVAGMFAVAHWDGRARCLILARDPAGEKPLCYLRQGTEVWFASAPTALLAHPQLAPDLDRDAARAFLTWGVVPPPATLHAGVHVVPPGAALVISPDGTHLIPYAPEPPTPRRVSPEDLGAALERAVAGQLTADVPIGLFLSGGLDSALVAWLAAERRPGLPAFAVGFPERSYDERPWAERAARDLGLPLTTVVADAPALLRARELALALPEPLADPAVLPTILLAERARQDVTVVLSGEGADELFGGYPTYLGHRLAAIMPSGLARLLLRLTPRPAAGARMPMRWLLRRFLEGVGLPALQRHLAWFSGALPPWVLTDALTLPQAPDPADAVAFAMQLDRTLYLPQRLLAKLDRATMRVALEARAPYLDPAVVALARGAGARAHGGLRGKRLLRRLARTRLPPYILRRVKHGLSVPVGRLITGPLRAEVARLLAPRRLDRLGLVRPEAVARLLAAHEAGEDHGRALWTLLTFEAWSERHGMDG